MRLICPGCGAQYEVDDGVIPDAGRDVQCSACGDVWFQKSQPMLLSGEEAVALPEDDWEPVVPTDSPAAAALREKLTAEDPEDVEEVHAAPRAGAVPRRSVDVGLLAILREEAEREAKARRADAGLPETQEEMVLEPAAAPLPAPPRETAPPVAAPSIPAPRPMTDAHAVRALPKIFAKGLDAGHDVIAEAEVVSLPDVGEINATLRASADRVGEAAAVDAPQVVEVRRSGFRLGFGSVMLAAALATAAYGFAPRIGETIPSLAPLLESYVARVDHGRIWLDHTFRVTVSEAQRALRG